jgi:hypothetical protein
VSPCPDRNHRTLPSWQAPAQTIASPDRPPTRGYRQSPGNLCHDHPSFRCSRPNRSASSSRTGPFRQLCRSRRLRQRKQADLESLRRCQFGRPSVCEEGEALPDVRIFRPDRLHNTQTVIELCFLWSCTRLFCLVFDLFIALSSRIHHLFFKSLAPSIRKPRSSSSLWHHLSGPLSARKGKHCLMFGFFGQIVFTTHRP